MNTRLWLLGPLLALLVLSPGLVAAADQSYIRGSWTMPPPLWGPPLESPPGDNWGSAEYQNWNYPQVKDWLMDVHTAEIEVYRDWWMFSSAKSFYYVIKMDSADGSSLTVVVKYVNSTTLWGALSRSDVYVGAKVNATNWRDIPLYGIYDPSDWLEGAVPIHSPSTFQLYIQPNRDGKAVITYATSVSERTVGVKLSEVFNLTAPYNMTWVYYHEGYGRVYVDLNNYMGSYSPPELQEPYNALREIFNWFRVIDWGGILSILAFLITFFVGIVQMTFPLLGVIVLFWFLDVIYTSITTGNIRLIGDAFLTIWGFILAIYRTVVGILELIWDLITFWS